MSFLDSYKHLEKLCGEVMRDGRKISAYIEEMENIPYGAAYVKSWDSDLKALKHYRWVRNQIVHDPNASEENLCEVEDEFWLDDFCNRILECTDPLALYYQAVQTRNKAKPSTPITTTGKTASAVYAPPLSKRPSGCGMLAVITIIMIATAICFLL